MPFIKKIFIPLAILFLLVLLGGYFRFHKLAEIPPGFNQDEAVNGYDAYSIAHTLKDHHGEFLPILFESFGDWTSPLLTYITVPFVKLLGLSIFSVRSIVTLFGTLLIIVFYFIGYVLTKKPYISLFAALIVVFSGILFHYSRWAIQPSSVPFFISIVLLSSFIVILTKQKAKGIVLLALAAGVTTYSYPTQKIFIPLLLLVFTLIYIRQLKWLIVLLWIIYIVFILPMTLISLSDKKYTTRYMQTSLAQIERQEGGGYIKAFTQRYFNYLNPKYLFSKGDPDIRFQPPHTTIIDSSLLIFYLIALGVSIYFSFVRRSWLNLDTNFYRYLTVLWLITPIPASLTKDYYHLLRFIHALPIVYILIFIGILSLYTALRTAKLKKFFIVSVISLIIFGFYTFTNTYFNDYSQTARKEFQYGVPQIITYLLQNENKFNSVTIDKRINQPYIYYLFFSKYDPQKLTEQVIQKQTFGKYVFKKIESRDADGLKMIYSFRNKNESLYEIYNKADGNWLVKKMYED